jgi:hypothetical protein
MQVMADWLRAVICSVIRLHPHGNFGFTDAAAAPIEIMGHQSGLITESQTSALTPHSG